MKSLLDTYKQSSKNSDTGSFLQKYKTNKEASVLKDISKQGAIGFGTGLTGSYGDLLDLVHANPKESLLPSQEQQAIRESEGSPEDLIKSTSDDTGQFGSGRLPTSKEIHDFLEVIGINPKAETKPGRIVEKGAHALGSAEAFGAGALQAALSTAGGVSGQGLREMGSPEWIASAVDLGISLSDIIRSGVKVLTKSAVKKPSGLSERNFESLKKPTKVTPGTKSNAIESVEQEFRGLSEEVQKSANKSLKLVREDPALEGKLSDAFENLKESAAKVEKQVPSPSYKKNFVKEYGKRTKTGFEETASEKELLKEFNNAFTEIHDKDLSLSSLIEQFRKNNKEAKKYLPFGPTAIENEAKKDILLMKNRAIEKTIETEFANTAEAKQFKALNDQWRDVQRIKTVDTYIDSIFPGEKIDFAKAKKSLSSSKTSKNLENALGKKHFNDFKQLTSDLVDQERAMKLLKANGLTFEDMGKKGAAMLLKPKIGKINLAGSYISQMWKTGLANPKYTREWAKAAKLFNSGKVKQALAIVSQLEDGED